MNKIFNAFIVLIAVQSIDAFSQEVVEETVVVTSALVDTNHIDKPLYVIDGNEILDGATTSLGEAIDGYLGISIADYGSAVGQPIIRGMSGPRVKILKNGMVNRDVSGLGADHLNDVDLNDISQIEIVKGPSSLLYANGTIGGIINIVDDCIAEMDFDGAEFAAGYETQSVNDGSSEYFNFKNNLYGFNFNFGYKNTEFGNYDVPGGAILHDEDHDEDHDDEHGDEHGDEHEEHEEDMGYVNNSDFASEATKFGISKTGDWGYIGISIDNLESVYGIPFHGDEHEDEHGDDHGDDHGDEDEHEEHEEERIFSTTDSESLTLKGSYNVGGSLVNKVDYTFRSSDYSLTEAHDEEGHDEDHGDEDHGDEDEHEEHAPTTFLNNAYEYGAIFDMSNDAISQKVSFNFVDEDTSIFGEEAFMNPANNRELTLGYFVSKDYEPFHVDFGIRLDQIDRAGSVSHEDGDLDKYSINDNTTSFALNVGRDLTDNLDVTLGFASVERLPSVIELFMNGPHMATGRFEVGDPNLNSETSNNLDITFNYQSGDYYAYASFFINDVDNYITLMDEDEGHEDDHHDEDHGDEDHGDEDDHGDDHDDHGNLIHANYIQEDAEFDGYEIEIGRTIELGSGKLTLSYGRDVINAQFTDGHNVPRINPSRNIYSLSYLQNDLVFKLNLKDVEKQNNFGEGESATSGYQMLDTRLTKTIDLKGSSILKLSLFGNNLLDEVARNHSSFVKNEVPLPGKNYGMKFNLTF
ncbi:TonB-dependent receptor [Gammaproteobacteria bacterium]|nr:TonB-dependent receptor [Gammaproteobacteria bacterium]